MSQHLFLDRAYCFFFGSQIRSYSCLSTVIRFWFTFFHSLIELANCKSLMSYRIFLQSHIFLSFEIESINWCSYNLFGSNWCLDLWIEPCAWIDLLRNFRKWLVRDFWWSTINKEEILLILWFKLFQSSQRSALKSKLMF